MESLFNKISHFQRRNLLQHRSISIQSQGYAVFSDISGEKAEEDYGEFLAVGFPVKDNKEN
jgi:hypothetical protein